MSPLVEFQGVRPRVGARVFIADTARVIGNVELGDDVNLWFGSVLRGDVGTITVGARANVQDLACLHMTREVSNVVVGADVTIGHGAIVHGAIVGDGCLIGMGSILLDNVELGAECIVGAGAVLTANKHFAPRSLVLGNPGRVVRELSEAEYRSGRLGAAGYLELVERYRTLLP
jgi:carbonic anhydrase/acetyltransferase-like protein (isoleucine patch superfamily)